MFSQFHFLNPEYLYLLFLVWISVYYLLYLQDNTHIWKKYIDSSLLPYLLDDTKKSFFRAPIFLGIVLSIMVIAIASPAYKLNKQTQSNKKSEIVWVLKTSKSMLSKDIMPSRHQRAIFKIEDYLSKHIDVKSSLVTFWGSAHLVMPLTKDKNIINKFALSLEPSVMPIPGEALYDAVKLASKQFVEIEGTIVVLSDSASSGELEKIENDLSLSKYNVVLYNISSKELRDENMNNAIEISFDDSDIEQLDNEVRQQFNNYVANQADSYENSGYLLVPLVVLLFLFFFTKGFIGELWRIK